VPVIISSDSIENDGDTQYPTARCQDFGTPSREVQGDTEENVLSGIPKSAVCVRKFDDSLSSAIRKTYRSSLRSSSMREPRDPLLKVV